MLGIVNSEIVKVTDESVQKEIDINTEVVNSKSNRWDRNSINTEVLGISEIVKVIDESVQKENRNVRNRYRSDNVK